MQKLRVKRDSVILARGWLVSSAVGHRDVVASYSPEGWDGSVLTGQMGMEASFGGGHGHNHMESHVIFRRGEDTLSRPSAMQDAGGG